MSPMTNTNLQVLIVEDERNLGDTLTQYLQSKGFECLLANTAMLAREIFYQTLPPIILMDIGLPDGSGLELASEFRTHRQELVLLFLSAESDPNTRLEGLEIGADDFITKPFELKELTLRLERILKTHSSLQKLPDSIYLGELQIFFKKYEIVDAQKKKFTLSQKECGILRLLLHKHNEVVDRNVIIDQIWGEDSFPSERTVDNYIVKLRRWCESDPTAPIRILAVRGIGYKLLVREDLLPLVSKYTR